MSVYSFFAGQTNRLDRACSILIFIGEFDPGSERTLAAGFIHASRTIKALFGECIKWRTGE